MKVFRVCRNYIMSACVLNIISALLSLSLELFPRLIISSWVVTFIMSLLPLVVEPYFKDEFYSRSGVCLALHITNLKHSGKYRTTANVLICTNCMQKLCHLFKQYILYTSHSNQSQSSVADFFNNHHLIIITFRFKPEASFLCFLAYFHSCRYTAAMQSHVVLSNFR